MLRNQFKETTYASPGLIKVARAVAAAEQLDATFHAGDAPWELTL